MYMLDLGRRWRDEMGSGVVHHCRPCGGQQPEPRSGRICLVLLTSKLQLGAICAGSGTGWTGGTHPDVCRMRLPPAKAFEMLSMISYTRIRA